MEQKTLTIWCTNPSSNSDSWHYSAEFSNIDMTETGWYKVITMPIEFPPPSREEMVPATVKIYEKRIEEIQTKANKHIMKLRVEIANMLALTHDVSAD